MFTRVRAAGAGVLLGLVGLAAGCNQADFGADIINKTPQAVFARLHVKPNDPKGVAVIAAEQRLGPGDRGFIGPVRTLNLPGHVFLTVDTFQNQRRPSTVDLCPGTTYIEVWQEGDGASGPLRLSQKP